MMRTLIIVFLALASCQSGEKRGSIKVIEEEGSVNGIDIPGTLYPHGSALTLHVKGVEAPILGKLVASDSGARFVPLVPLTRGMTYEVKSNDEVIGVISIPVSNGPAPVLQAIYPVSDTVPENLLKVYLRFSQPMMEGRSASFVHLLKDGRDTMKGTFLDLQPELWNGEGTVLTLWLDPGRIKLDLIPNKELGNPLQRGARYELVIASGWRSKTGVAMNSAVRKTIIVGDRDDESPDVHTWKLKEPAAGTRDPLVVDFGEPLDRLLAEEVIAILDDARQPVDGKVTVSGDDSRVEFIPENPWLSRTYILTVEGRLEDLSGNNLNRLFETDLLKSKRTKPPQAIHERKFTGK